MVTLVLGELTPVEESLVDYVRRGKRLDLAAGNGEIDEAAMRSWGDSRTCRATVIRDILRGRLATDLDPHGLRLRGARISGRLDLQNLTTNVNFALTDCLLEEGVLARNARMAFVGLTGCRLEHPARPPMDAAGIACSVLDLRRATIIGHTARGAVRLTGARIVGQLRCDSATLRNDSGPALVANGLQVGQDMHLGGGSTATQVHGEVRLTGARIVGQLDCKGARLRNDSGPALVANGLQVGQDMHLGGGFTATGAGQRGAVRLVGASIIGNLECDGATLENKSGPALVADSLQVGRDVHFRPEFTATGAGESGAVRLVNAHISGNLECDGATLGNKSGPALRADSLQVDQHMFLRGGFTGTGAGEDGAVRLRSAHIGGQLSCIEATLGNDSGPALIANNLQVGQAIHLHSGFVAIGGGSGVTIDLTGARVRGTLEFDPRLLTHAADDLRLAVNGLTCAGVPTSISAGLPLPISVRGWLDLLRRATPSYAAQRYQRLAVGYKALDLEQSNPEQQAHAGGSHLLAVDGLRYAGVPKPISTVWLRLLQKGTPSYSAQPYQHLAAGYRALGDDGRVRQILIAQRDDQLARGRPRWSERLWGRITKVTLGYGYQPWKALLFLVAVIALSCVLAVVLGWHGALVQTDHTATPGRPCTLVQRVSVGLDLNLPVGTSVARAGCDLTKDSTSAAAAWLTAESWMLRLLAWVFAALFIAGFTSAVRKT